MKSTNILLFSTLFVLLMGCNSSQQAFNQGLALIDKAAAIAERQGTAYSATLRWDGNLGAAWIQKVQLQSGVTVEINFHGNAAAERATVTRPSVTNPSVTNP